MPSLRALSAPPAASEHQINFAAAEFDNQLKLKINAIDPSTAAMLRSPRNALKAGNHGLFKKGALMNLSFELNGKEFSELSAGSMRFKAFSGQEAYRNKPQFHCAPRLGPIPKGRYFIVDRPTGGRLGPVLDYLKGKHEWFALLADDLKIDDATFCDQVERGQFRLHPKGIQGLSQGCVTLENASDFSLLRRMLLASQTLEVPERGSRPMES